LNRRLFHFLARRVGFGSAEREARERSRGTHHNCKFLHHSSLVRFPLVAIPHSIIALFTNNATGPSGGCARRAETAVEKPLFVVVFEAAPQVASGKIDRKSVV